MKYDLASQVVNLKDKQSFAKLILSSVVGIFWLSKDYTTITDVSGFK